MEWNGGKEKGLPQPASGCGTLFYVIGGVAWKPFVPNRTLDDGDLGFTARTWGWSLF
jgi:hypothetical protein